MNPTVTKLVTALVASALGLAGYLGAPGVDDPATLALVEKLSASASMLLTGWLFMRQHWLLGSTASTQPVEHFDVKTDAKTVVRGEE
jgi:hypothetical protein